MSRAFLVRCALWCLVLILSACSGSDRKGTGDDILGEDGGPGARRDAATDEDGGPGDDSSVAEPDGGDAGGGGDQDAGSDADPGCGASCEADDCGQVPDGCGGFLSCGSCAEGKVCGIARANKCDFPPPVECTPKTADQVCPDKCGSVEDGCSGVIVCNNDNGGVTCGQDELCGGYDGNRQPNTCVAKPTCTPNTCAGEGVECGPIGDGCGGVLDCTAETGGCSDGKQCGTGENSGKCVNAVPTCTPMAIADACEGTCGVVDDGCGHPLDCESSPLTACPGDETCGGGGVPGECGVGTVGCTPIDVGVACAGKCGFVSDGCSGGYTCNSENGGETCDAVAGESCGGGGTPNACGKPACVPKSEPQACPNVDGYATCGQQPDGCGGLIDCGGCLEGQQCGLTTANLCGDIPVCSPTPVATACASKCGTVPDGCGGSYTCSGSNGGVTCTGDEYCGANAPNKCGAPPVTCTPLTCADLGHSCGLASDGCGNIINCWPSCPSDSTSCSGSCGDYAACLSDSTTGAQSCVTGGPSCSGSLCDDLPSDCGSDSPTRLTGTVRTPGREHNGGWVNQIPVPNAIVYIPAEPGVALPTIFEGVEAGNPASCGRCEDEELVAEGESVLAAAVTNYKGEFTLEGRIPVGTAFKLVVKVGKWRRVVQISAGVAQACTTQTLNHEQTRLPKHNADGLSGTHLPKVAISTGDVDEMECVFRNFGVDDSEFTVPSESGRFHMYRANGARMAVQTGNDCTGRYGTGPWWDRPRCRWNNDEGCVNGYEGCAWEPIYEDVSVDDSNLYSDQATLNSYDLVIWDCEGFEQQHDDHDAKIESYVNAGGRMFASHFSYAWIEGNGSLSQSADWYTDGSSDSATGYISLPNGPTARTGANGVKSLVFRDWLDWQGALSGTSAGQLDNPNTPRFGITDPRDRAGANVGASTDEWVHRNVTRCSNDAGRWCSDNGDCENGGSCGPAQRVQQLSFNTPYGAAESNICGRVAYSGFHVASANNDGDNDYFPGVCNDGELSAQEKVLVFMLFDLATCVSAGDPPAPPACTPKTEAQVCPGENDACGYVSDGCGGVVDCAGCSAGFYCDGNTCRPQECTPATCASLGYTCGEHADGCGGIARNSQGVEGCGTCTDGQICGFDTPGVCGGCVQIPIATACPDNWCGSVSDGCGGTHNCGGCEAGEVCGGGGANICGPGSCTTIDQATACANKDCGLVSDGCGGTYSCGTCTAPDTCGGGGTPNVCGHVTCTPLTQAEACAGLECGWVSDGCGGALQCGSCPDGGVCGGDGPNLCGDSCTPTTCSAEGAECGAIADGCGGILHCGGCPVGQTCGADGPNQCGGGSCTPDSCSAAGAECGLIGDGCGGVLDCGICTEEGESCGGAGVPNQCGPGTGGCDPNTCEAQSVECGAASDGCGGLLSCGTCPSGYTCERGACVTVVVVL